MPQLDSQATPFTSGVPSLGGQSQYCHPDPREGSKEDTCPRRDLQSQNGAPVRSGSGPQTCRPTRAWPRPAPPAPLSGPQPGGSESCGFYPFLPLSSSSPRYPQPQPEAGSQDAPRRPHSQAEHQLHEARTVPGTPAPSTAPGRERTLIKDTVPMSSCAILNSNKLTPGYNLRNATKREGIYSQFKANY